MKSKKTEKQFEKWIIDAVKHYKPMLGLDLQIIEVEKVPDISYLQIKCTYPYLDPTIGYSEHAFKDWAKGKVRRDRILHELCHALTDPIYCKAISRYVSKDEITDERERLTDTIAMIVRNFDK